MPQQRIDIMIPADGEMPQIKPTGWAGPACKAATAEIEKNLGVETVDMKKEPEYFAEQKKTTQQQQASRG